ncbi:hypothetical protein D6U78_10935 [Vibrio cholerae]|uniref:Uncharacterized protein n=1 Tax=Vibrio cholerae TaxID=666 RepID=A0ABD7SRM0_VIBCL|nr:hypothetical protein [Vibrio cholerae]MVF55408.1 hypothetical protein [Vibrio cholerae]TXX67419.1 hypothetical protein FXF03_02230 [Vibrio cholerae]GIB00133.1 hypothetical protein VCSRO136_2522 [Vibrio cholerae]HAS7807681.1 hypothetical protein [Vibrio cholerae]
MENIHENILLQNKDRRFENAIRGCCEWWVFRDTFLASCRIMHVPLLCVNRLEMRRHWRSGWTGRESADWFRIQLVKEIY